MKSRGGATLRCRPQAGPARKKPEVKATPAWQQRVAFVVQAMHCPTKTNVRASGREASRGGAGT